VKGPGLDPHHRKGGKKKKEKRAKGVAQGIEYLPSKHEALSSKTRKKERKKGQAW
jgi:hypothetical protein